MADANFRDGAGEGNDEGHDVVQMHAPIDREHAEPDDGAEPVPLLLILAALALAMGCGWYLGSQSNAFDVLALDGDQVVRGAVMAVEPPSIDPLAKGRRVYNNCMACHQQDGRGIAGQFPPLADSEWVLGESRVLARILLHGMHKEVVVAGARYDGLMPAWERLEDEAIAGVLTYVRSAWGNDAPPVGPEIIAHERRLTQGRASPWTARELLDVLP